MKALFTADLDAQIVQAVAKVEEDKLKNMNISQWVSPWIMEKSGALDLLLVEPPVQRALANWGAQYKKAQASARTYTVTFPFQETQGKEHVQKMFEAILPQKHIVDVSSVSGGESFMKAWCSDARLTRKQLASIPTMRACSRLWQVGSNCISWSRCKRCLHTCMARSRLRTSMTQPRPWNSSQIARLRSLRALKADGVQMQQVVLKPRQILYIPSGWLAMEVAQANCVHLYGVRKSFFLSSLTDEYKLAMCSMQVLGNCETP